MLNVAECCLCSQIAGQPSNDLIARLLPDQPYVRRVMLDTSLFAVVPSLGPLIGGHSLVCPKSHIRSFANLDTKGYEEFRNLKRVLKSALKHAYGADVHLFEHGAATGGNRILCSVDHAHMHFVPLPERTPLEAVEQIEWMQFDGSIETLRDLAGSREYIFYESPDGDGRLLLSDGSEFESQYMRRLMAKALSRGDRWNWREQPDAPAADATWRVLAAAMG
jgi:ATP adenylyltransferase